MSRPTTLQKKFAFRPGFEALEERTVLNATAIFNAGTITIAGDKRSDSVVIKDEGNLDATKQVTVFINGQQALQVPSQQVNAIQFSMGKGNDSVEYDLTGTLVGLGTPGSPRTVSGDLGKGNDHFTANIQGILASGQLGINVTGGDGKDAMTVNMQSDMFGLAKLDVTMDGGKGNDALAFNSATGTPLGGPGVEVGVGTQMNVNLLGGKDKDTIKMDYAGDLDGTLNFFADGAKGKDLISATFNLDAGSGFLINPGNVNVPNGVLLPTPAVLNAKIQGGADNDNLTLAINRVANGGNITITATVDSGPGHDIVSTPGNVSVTVI